MCKINDKYIIYSLLNLYMLYFYIRIIKCYFKWIQLNHVSFKQNTQFRTLKQRIKKKFKFCKTRLNYE